MNNLNESSLSRILQHINKSNTTLAVIGAYLEPNRLKETEHLVTIPNRAEAERINKRRHEDLRNELKGKYGYIEVNGGWAYNDIPGIHEEKAFFVPNMDKETAKLLCRKYNQDAVLVKDETGLYLMNQSGAKEMEFGPPGTVGIINDQPKYMKGVPSYLQTDRTHRTIGRAYNAELLRKGFSALIKANKSQRGAKFSFVGNKSAPTVIESLVGLDFGKMPKTKLSKM